MTGELPEAAPGMAISFQHRKALRRPSTVKRDNKILHSIGGDTQATMGICELISIKIIALQG